MTDETMDNGEETPVIYHEDPAVNSILTTIADKAAYYALAVMVLGGKADKSFTEWVDNDYPGVEKGDIENVPDLSNVVEWMHLDASLASLLALKDVIANVQKELHLAIFGHYAKKNVRGQVTHKLEDLKDLRKELITLMDGTVAMSKSVPMLSALADYTLIEALPNIGKRSKFGDGLIWSIADAPSAPKSDTDKAASIHGVNLRSHNTTVKFVVNGKLPDEDLTLKLGELCTKYFAKSTQDVAKMFDNWSEEYYSIGSDAPAKAVKRDDNTYWLTSVGK